MNKVGYRMKNAQKEEQIGLVILIYTLKKRSTRPKTHEESLAE